MQKVTINGWLEFLVDHEPIAHRKKALQFARKQIEEWGKMDIVGIPRGGWVYEQIVDFSPPLTDAAELMDTRTLERYNSRTPDFESWYTEWHTETGKENVDIAFPKLPDAPPSTKHYSTGWVITTKEWLEALVDSETVQHRKYALEKAIKVLETRGTINCIGIPRGGWVYKQIVDKSPILSDAEKVMDAGTLEQHNRRPNFYKTSMGLLEFASELESEECQENADDEENEENIEYMLSELNWIWKNRFRPAERRLLDALDRRMGPPCDWNDYYDEGEISKSDILKSQKMISAVQAWCRS